MKLKIALVFSLASFFLSLIVFLTLSALFPSWDLSVWSGLLIFLVLEMLILSGVFDPKSPLFGSVFWRGSKKYPVLALTFDDGPSEPYTSEILEILRKYQIPATFFVLGKKIELYPQAIKKIAAAGQEIGNHGYSHQLLPLKSPGKVVKEIRRTEELVFSATGQRPRLFRAPHGFKSPWLVRAVRKAGYRPVAWTCGVWDTDRPGEKTIIQRSLKGFQNGAILLFHDGRGLEAKPDCSQLVKALPAIIEEALGQGYKFMTVSELMAVGRDTIKKVDAVTN